MLSKKIIPLLSPYRNYHYSKIDEDISKSGNIPLSVIKYIRCLENSSERKKSDASLVYE